MWREIRIPLSLNTVTIFMIAAFSVVLNLLGAYFLFYVVDGPNDTVTIFIKVSALAVVTVLYAWFTWSNRAKTLAAIRNRR